MAIAFKHATTLNQRVLKLGLSWIGKREKSQARLSMGSYTLEPFTGFVWDQSLPLSIGSSENSIQPRIQWVWAWC